MSVSTQETETVNLTIKIFEALLYMTSSPAHYTEKTAHFVTALHKAVFVQGNWWRTELNEADMETLVVMLDGYCLNRPQALRTRFTNYMTVNSELYSKVVARQAVEASA
jgi:hypothetical protein